MIELFSSDNMVLISRITALFEGADIAYTVLDGHASLFGTGIEGVARRVLVHPDDVNLARRLIREEKLDNDLDFAKGIDS